MPQNEQKSDIPQSLSILLDKTESSTNTFCGPATFYFVWDSHSEPEKTPNGGPNTNSTTAPCSRSYLRASIRVPSPAPRPLRALESGTLGGSTYCPGKASRRARPGALPAADASLTSAAVHLLRHYRIRLSSWQRVYCCRMELVEKSWLENEVWGEKRPSGSRRCGDGCQSCRGRGTSLTLRERGAL